MVYMYRSNVEADLTIEKQWRTSLQVCMYSKLYTYKAETGTECYACTYTCTIKSYTFIINSV